VDVVGMGMSDEYTAERGLRFDYGLLDLFHFPRRIYDDRQTGSWIDDQIIIVFEERMKRFQYDDSRHAFLVSRICMVLIHFDGTERDSR
jgi:hypothetical protein